MTSLPDEWASSQPYVLVPYIRTIVDLADPEKILLLSASYDFHYTESIFLKLPLQTFDNGRYHLLVLCNKEDAHALKNDEIMINTRLNNSDRLELNLMGIQEFNEKVRAGDQRTTLILLNAMLWYDKDKIPFADPISYDPR